MNGRATIGCACFLATLLPPVELHLRGSEIDASALPAAAKATVDFDRDVKPIFESVCFRCHGPEKPKSRFRLDNRESALKGGENNKDDIVPGDSAKSKLIHYVARVVEDMEMPPPGKGDVHGDALPQGVTSLMPSRSADARRKGRGVADRAAQTSDRRRA